MQFFALKNCSLIFFEKIWTPGLMDVSWPDPPWFRPRHSCRASSGGSCRIRDCTYRRGLLQILPSNGTSRKRDHTGRRQIPLGDTGTACTRGKDGSSRIPWHTSHKPYLAWVAGKRIDQCLDHKRGQVFHRESILERNSLSFRFKFQSPFLLSVFLYCS